MCHKIFLWRQLTWKLSYIFVFEFELQFAAAVIAYTPFSFAGIEIMSLTHWCDPKTNFPWERELDGDHMTCIDCVESTVKFVLEIGYYLLIFLALA